MACAQMIKSHMNAPFLWEQAVQGALAEIAEHAALHERIASLKQIPFKAIITTNFDPSFEGDLLEPAFYSRLLREGSVWIKDGADSPASPVYKIHGDANGDPAVNPLVFAVEDYRQRVHGEKPYANFLRSVFATHTVLFLGVSFTDEYLNELRSEVVSFSWGRKEPWAYAVISDRPDLIRDHSLGHDGLEILHYDSKRLTDFSGFDRWLEAIRQATSVPARLQQLLAQTADQSKVIWIDSNPNNNDIGIRALGDSD